MKTPVNWMTGCCFARELTGSDGMTLTEDECTAACLRINTHDALVAALQWYVVNDDVSDSEGNEYWLDGMRKARDVLRAARGE